MFDDLLMHGYIDHHDDPTHFFVGQLSAKQMDALVEVVVCYLGAVSPTRALADSWVAPLGRRFSAE